MDATFWATVAGVIVAGTGLAAGYIGLRRQLKQNYSIVGAQSAIEWREQVIALYERGLTPGEIRYIMYLENGGKGYEYNNGSIDQIVGNLPHNESVRVSSEHSGRKSIPRPRLPFWNGEEVVASWFDPELLQPSSRLQGRTSGAPGVMPPAVNSDGRTRAAEKE